MDKQYLSINLKSSAIAYCNCCKHHLHRRAMRSIQMAHPFFSFRSMKVRNYIQLKMLLHAFTICSMATNQPNWENPSIYPLAIQHSNGKSAPFRGDFATFYLYMRQQFEDFLVLSTSWLKKSCPNPLEYHHFPIN
jgi:hypothetical protein